MAYEADIDALRNSYRSDGLVDVVVFSAPQLSLFELRDLADLCDYLCVEKISKRKVR